MCMVVLEFWCNIVEDEYCWILIKARLENRVLSVFWFLNNAGDKGKDWKKYENRDWRLFCYLCYFYKDQFLRKMSYNIDMLKFSKNTVKTPLQVCFCAATTRNFIGTDTHKVTKQEVEDIDITAACDAIMDGLSTSENRPRMSLHMSSQLMYGALRLFKEQVSSAEESAENLFSAVITSSDVEAESDFAKKTKRINKKNTKTNEHPSDPVLPESVPDIDIINILSKDLHEDLHLMDEIDNYQLPPQPDEFPFGVLTDDVEDIDMVTNELCRDMMREEQHPRHSISVLNRVQQDQEAQEDITSPLPFENVNPTEPQKKQPQSISNESFQDILRTQTPPRPLYGLPPIQTSSSSENATTAYSPSKPINRTWPLADEPLATSTPPRYVTSTREDAPLLQPTDSMDVQMSGSQTGMQPHAINAVAAPQMMDMESDELTKVDLPHKPMEVDESDINDILIKSNNKLIAKSKSKKKIIVDERNKLKWIKEPRPQIFTKSLDIVISEPVSDLLKLPTTLKRKMFHNDGRSWAYCLIKMFNENTQKPYRNFVEMDNLSNNQGELQEESLQPIALNKVQLPSSKIVLKDLRVIPHESNVTPDNNLIRLETPGPSEDINIDTAFDEPMDVIRTDGMQPFPTYSDNDDEPDRPVDSISNLAPIVKKFKPSLQSKMESLNSEVNLNIFLSKSKFFDSIQIYWKKIEEDGKKNKDREVNVTFDKLLNYDNVHVDQVIQYLYYCFDLEKGRKLYLKQETAYGTLYIIKPQ